MKYKKASAAPNFLEIYNAPKRQCNAAYSRISSILLVYLRNSQLPDFAIQRRGEELMRDP
jgi:hypothetical protein